MDKRLSSVAISKKVHTRRKVTLSCSPINFLDDESTSPQERADLAFPKFPCVSVKRKLIDMFNSNEPAPMATAAESFFEMDDSECFHNDLLPLKLHNRPVLRLKRQQYTQ